MKQPTLKTKIPGLKSARMRQYGLIAVVFVGAYGLLYLIFATGSGEKNPEAAAARKQSTITSVHVQAAGAQLDPRESWIGGAGAKVADHDTRLQQQEQLTKELRERFATLDKEVHDKSLQKPVEVSAPAALGAPPSVPAKATATNAKGIAFPPGTPGAITDATRSVLPPGVTLPPGANANVNNPFAVDSQSVQSGIGHFALGSVADTKSVGTAKTGAIASAGGAGAGKAARSTGTYLPVGFAQATLLGGIDAPTGGQAQNNPLPVIFRLDDMAFLPNHFRANIKSCLLIGAAYGSLSAERAYVRLETLSCVRNDGRVIETTAHGVAYGEDGKLGLRGRVVTKQGQVLANALLAGVISGIGQGIQYQNTLTTVTSAGNVLQTQGDNASAFRSGLSGGVGRALDRMANYYITLAEKLFPVIEVDSNRHVDVAFTKGTDLEAPLPELGGDNDEDMGNE